MTSKKLTFDLLSTAQKLVCLTGGDARIVCDHFGNGEGDFIRVETTGSTLKTSPSITFYVEEDAVTKVVARCHPVYDENDNHHEDFKFWGVFSAASFDCDSFVKEAVPFIKKHTIDHD